MFKKWNQISNICIIWSLKLKTSILFIKTVYLLLQVVMAEGGSIAIEAMLECAICHEVMVQPRVLPCQHTFCHKCLDKCIRHYAQDDNLPCPVCRAPYKVRKSGVHAIPKNVFAVKLLETTQKKEDCKEDIDKNKYVSLCSIEPEECLETAVTYCTICKEYMCEKC